MVAPVAYRTSGDGVLRAIWLGERRDTGIREMTAASPDRGRQLPPKRRKSGSRRAAKRAGVSPVCAEELAELQVFADVPARDLAALAANLKPLHAAAGEVLMRQGEKAVSFSIITSGRVEIRHVGPDGQVTVTELSPGHDSRRNRIAAKRDSERRR